MRDRRLDYAGVLSTLLGLQGRSTDLGVRGIEENSPLSVFASGALSTSEIYGKELVGYHRHTLNVVVGDAQVTLAGA